MPGSVASGTLCIRLCDRADAVCVKLL
jgi:hypothetical protein